MFRRKEAGRNQEKVSKEGRPVAGAEAGYLGLCAWRLVGWRPSELSEDSGCHLDGKTVQVTADGSTEETRYLHSHRIQASEVRGYDT